MLLAIRRRRAIRALTTPSIFELQPIERRLLLVGTISGTVFSDYDSDGTQDAGEPGLAGWTVYIDANDNNIPDTAELKRTTDANGFYEFAGLTAPATYNVREVLKNGYQQTIPGSGGVILGGPGAGAGQGAGRVGGAGDDPNAGRPFTQTEIVVAFKGNTGRSQLVEAVNANANIRRVVNLPASTDMFAVRSQRVALVEVKLPAGVDPKLAVQRFESLPNVAWAQPNYLYEDMDYREFTPNDPQYASQYHHPLMKQNLAWDTHLGSTQIKIGITDDGVLTNHPDLIDNIWVNPGEIPNNGIDDDNNGKIDDVNGWDIFHNDNNPNPNSASFDHGTHVAGIAAARTNNGIGVSGISNSAIIPIRFYQGSGWTSTIVANSYRYAGDVAAHIVNTSYNVDQFSNDNIFAAGLQYMYDHGVMHFNSAGNNGQLNPPRQKWDQSLFVVNTTSTDVRNSGSNYGWGVDITSPGTSILATAIGGSLTTPTYELKTGTSMAAPGGAGVAALIWSLHPEWTREQVAAQLIGTADNISAQNPSIANLIGSGRANSFRALTEQLRPPRMKIMTNFPAEGALTTVAPSTFNLDVANVFDPATMIASNFELRGAGPDGEFDTSDDRLIPTTFGFGVTNTQVYMIGTNRINFTVTGAMTPDTYRFAAKTALTDPFGQPIDGNGDGVGGDAFTRTFTLLGATNKFIVNLADGQSVTNAHFGNHDIVGPRALASALAFATSPHRITVQFNEDVSDSLSLSDLAVQNLTTGLPLDTSAFSFSYDTATNTATWNVNGILPDARLRGTIAAAGVSDLSGNPLDGDGNGTGGDDLNFDFFFLMADANHDGRVNLDDFNIIAANFGQIGTDFTRGDFNYDGQTNLDDFNILAARWGVALAGPSATASSGPSTSLDDLGDDRDSLDELLA